MSTTNTPDAPERYAERARRTNEIRYQKGIHVRSIILTLRAIPGFPRNITDVEVLKWLDVNLPIWIEEAGIHLAPEGLPDRPTTDIE